MKSPVKFCVFTREFPIQNSMRVIAVQLWGLTVVAGWVTKATGRVRLFRVFENSVWFWRLGFGCKACGVDEVLR